MLLVRKLLHRNAVDSKADKIKIKSAEHEHALVQTDHGEEVRYCDNCRKKQLSRTWFCQKCNFDLCEYCIGRELMRKKKGYLPPFLKNDGPFMWGISLNYIASLWFGEDEEDIPTTWHNVRDFVVKQTRHNQGSDRSLVNQFRENPDMNIVSQDIDMVVSFVWSDSVKEIVGALIDLKQEMGRDDLFVWMDVFCLDQHNASNTSLATFPVKEYDELLKRIGVAAVARVDIVDVEGYPQPYATRAWCCYELSRIKALVKEIHMVIPQSSLDELAIAISPAIDGDESIAYDMMKYRADAEKQSSSAVDRLALSRMLDEDTLQVALDFLFLRSWEKVFMEAVCDKAEEEQSLTKQFAWLREGCKMYNALDESELPFLRRTFDYCLKHTSSKQSLAITLVYAFHLQNAKRVHAKELLLEEYRKVLVDNNEVTQAAKVKDLFDCMIITSTEERDAEIARFGDAVLEKFMMKLTTQYLHFEPKGRVRYKMEGKMNGDVEGDHTVKVQIDLASVNDTYEGYQNMMGAYIEAARAMNQKRLYKSIPAWPGDSCPQGHAMMMRDTYDGKYLCAFCENPVLEHDHASPHSCEDCKFDLCHSCWSVFLNDQKRSEMVVSKLRMVMAEEEEVLPALYDMPSDPRLLGVSVRFLNTVFSHIHESAKIQDICEIVKHITKPSNGYRSFGAYLIRAGSHAVNKPERFISYAWLYPWQSLIASLMSPLADGEDMFVWLDVFCVDQWEAGSANLDFKDWQDTFGKMLMSIGKATIVLSPYHNPITPKRSWCVFEMVKMKQLGIEADIHMDPKQEAKLVKLSGEGKTSVTFFKQIFENIDVESATASKEHDRNEIKALLVQTGIINVNNIVMLELKRWLVAVLTRAALHCEQAGKAQVKTFACHLLSLIYLHRSLNDDVVAYRYCQQCVLVTDEHPLDDVTQASLYTMCYGCANALGEEKEAQVFGEKAVALETSNSKKARQEELVIALKRADMTAGRGDFVTAEKDYREIIDGFTEVVSQMNQESTSSKQSLDFIEHSQAHARARLATVLRQQKKFEEVETLMRQALAIFERVDGKNSYSFGEGICALANYLKETDKPDQALSLFQEGLQVLKKLRGVTDSQVINIMQAFGQCLLSLDRSADAILVFEESADAASKASFPEAPYAIRAGNDMVVLAHVMQILKMSGAGVARDDPAVQKCLDRLVFLKRAIGMKEEADLLENAGLCFEVTSREGMTTLRVPVEFAR